MQSFRMLGAIAVAAFVSGTAYAQPSGAGEVSGQATLAEPAAASKEATVAGVAWRCDGAECAGRGTPRAANAGLVAECKKVAAVIGPVSSYRSRGHELTSGQIRACNRGAIRIQTVSR
ncbi:CC_3452 family protein [Phenylobacterium sp.]|uniref:CC_3452 family protein n=1 Tax=Phenylobacterium sp. TaxID=1871053 RepID=UPI00391A4CC4